MPHTMSHQRRDDLLNSVGKATAAEAKLPDNSVVTAAQIAEAARIIRLAVDRSGVLKKSLGNGKDKAQVTKKLDGAAAHRLWFHEMLATWPEEVWIELIAILALRYGGTVERTVRMKERA